MRDTDTTADELEQEQAEIERDDNQDNSSHQVEEAASEADMTDTTRVNEDVANRTRANTNGGDEIRFATQQSPSRKIKQAPKRITPYHQASDEQARRSCDEGDN